MSAQQKPSIRTICFLFIIALILYFRLFRFPNTPIDPATGDQSIFLIGGVKILQGKTIYKDFFQFITPGTEYLCALLIKVFGQTAALPCLMTVAIGTSLAAAGLTISEFIFSGWMAYAPPVLFLSAGLVPSLAITHHSFSTLFVLCALAAALRSFQDHPMSHRYLYVVGGLCGLAFFFTHTRGLLALAGFCVFYSFLYRSWRSIAALLTSFAIVSCLLLIPVVGAAGAHPVWNDLVSYPASSYRAVPWNDFRAYGADLTVSGLRDLLNPSQVIALLKWSLIYLISPGIYALCAIRLASRRRSLNELELRTVLLVTIIGMSLFLSVAYSPTLKRMGVVSLPAIVLLFWLFRSDGKLARFFTLGLALFAGLTLPAGIIHSQHTSSLVSTPSGRVALSDSRSWDLYDQYTWLQQNTKPGDVVYSAGYLEFNYLFKLTDPVRIPLLSTYDYTTREQVQDTIEDLDKSQTKFVFWPVACQRITLNTDEAFDVQDHLEPLRVYLHTNYRLVSTFNNFDQVWQRKDD